MLGVLVGVLGTICGISPGSANQGRATPCYLYEGLGSFPTPRLGPECDAYVNAPDMSDLERAEALNERAWGYLEHDQPRNAVLDADRAIRLIANELRPRTTLRLNLHLTRGKAHRRLGEYEQAANDFAAALTYAPQRADIHEQLGWALMQVGRVDEAAAAQRKALELRAQKP